LAEGREPLWHGVQSDAKIGAMSGVNASGPVVVVVVVVVVVEPVVLGLVGLLVSVAGWVPTQALSASAANMPQVTFAITETPRNGPRRSRDERLASDVPVRLQVAR
jgi:hypothetical protein